MVVVICPTCETDLIEKETQGLHCLMCGDEFQVFDAHVKEVCMEDLYKRLLEHKNTIITRRTKK